ncbi:SDR family oxidoreductase [Gibbsiella quercinecans]|uniref:SDR family oxidoreductase n=1 Tax=Gibbsiella quercinecans TaxID=929813 RepID=UPI003A4DECEB
MNHAFVTGATGLLGNNLVRALLDRNIRVTALVRCAEKAKRQFANLPVTYVEGDLCHPESYRSALQGCDRLFHTAAYFRDSFKGGKHWQALYDTNIKGTADLLQLAWDAGIRRVVHTSSIAVLYGEQNQLIDESMSRDNKDKDDYYRSKILSEEVVSAFLEKHPDMFACFVLPGWMFGPGDIGPTSSGQFVIDYMQKKLPGVLPASFSLVDARDVAEHEILAMECGRRGERYLAAGCHMTMGELMNELAKVSNIPAPTKPISLLVLRLLAQGYEIYHRLTKKPVLLSKSSVDLMSREYLRTRFSHTKSQRELGCEFRPLDETLDDVLKWYQQHNFLTAK